MDYTSQVSEIGFTTDNVYNPNDIGCQADLNNGITGTSGAWQQGEPVVTAARAPNFNDYSHGAPFLADRYDISELAGEEGAVVRFSYNTDGAFDRPGWFIDDIVVKVDGDRHLLLGLRGGRRVRPTLPGRLQRGRLQGGRHLHRRLGTD